MCIHVNEKPIDIGAMDEGEIVKGKVEDLPFVFL